MNGTVETSCPLCFSNKSDHLFWTRDYVFGCSDDDFGVRKCLACGCGFLSPRPTREDIPNYYPPEFYWSWEGQQEKIEWEEVLSKRKEQLAAKAVWLEGVPPGRLLDIGAQKGEFLWFMQQRGWRAEGVELDSTVPNPGGMPIRYGDFLTMDFEEGAYDVVTFWAVLEHVYEPRMFIEKASRLLKPGGKLIGLVTNLDSLQARVYSADDYPRHLTLFTKGSLAKLGTATGLELRSTKTDQTIFGGTMNGGLLYAVKRMLGYSTDNAMREWKQIREPDLFWTTWRGRPAPWVKAISRLDRLLTLPVERLLDKLGYGFILTFRYDKPLQSRPLSSATGA